MNNIIYKKESYDIIGICFDIHNHLGAGFLEIVYKDALEYEFKNHSIPFQREVEYSVNYKGTVLPHKFYADFVLYDKIILEIKCVSRLINEHSAQVINYLKVSNNRLGLLVNFGEAKLVYKRLVL